MRVVWCGGVVQELNKCDVWCGVVQGLNSENGDYILSAVHPQQVNLGASVFSQ